MKTRISEIKKLFAIAVAIIISTSCLKRLDVTDLDTSMELSPHYGIPVAVGSLTLRDIAKERKDTVVYYTENGSNDTLIKIVYTIDTIRNFKGSEILKPPHFDPIEQIVKLGTLTINDQKTDKSTSLDTLMLDNFSLADHTEYRKLAASPTPVSIGLKTATKQQEYKLTPFGEVDWVYTLSGDLSMTVTNKYKVPVQFKIHLVTDLSATNEGKPEIGVFDFTNVWIQSGTTETRSIPITGLKLSSKLSYTFSDLKLDAVTNVRVFMNDVLDISCSLSDTKVSSGRAALPPQIVKKADTTWFYLSTYKGKKLWRLDVLSGALNYKLESSMPSGMNIKLSMPSVKKAGTIVTDNIYLSNTGKISSSWNLQGYSMDLTQYAYLPGKQDSGFNRLPVIIEYEFNTKGKLVSFDENHTLTATFSNDDSLDFSLVKGNFGYDTINIGNKNFLFNIDEFIGDLYTGKIIFSDPAINVDFTNSAGVSAIANLDFKGKAKDGKTTPLFKAGTAYTIKGPDFTQIGQTIFTSMGINKGNSEIVSFMSNLPHELNANGTVITNYGIKESDIKNFLTDKSVMSVKINAELPLKFSMQDLTLKQDFDVQSKSDSIKNIDIFRLLFYVKNQFPIDVTVRLTMLDTNLANPILDTLSVMIVKAAPVDENGKTSSAGFTKMRQEIMLTKDKDLQKIQHFLNANRIRVEAKLNTYNQKNVTLYTYYTIAFQLALDAKLTFKTSME